MASLVRLLVLCLLFGACAPAKRRYLSVNMDELLRSKALLDCPPWKKSGTDHDRTIMHLKLLHPSALQHVSAATHATRQGQAKLEIMYSSVVISF